MVGRLRAAFNVDLSVRSIFASPTVARLARVIEGILRTEIPGSGEPLVRASRDEELPLSFAQDRLWFLDQFEPGRSLYNLPMHFRLNGLIDVQALERSFGEIIRRHESLRTTFAAVDGHPVEVISASKPFLLSVIALNHLQEDEREAESLRFIADEAKQPFDLANGPLYRFGLLRLSEQEHVLLITLHHIISDGWSMNVLVRELAALYKAFSAGSPSPLAELPIQYADFAVWQRKWLQGEVSKSRSITGSGNSREARRCLICRQDRPRPTAQTFRGSRLTMRLTPDLSQELRKLSQVESVTMFMTLMAAFKIILHRQSGQDDIVVGMPVAGRARVETEELIGFFLNTLVLREDLSGDPTFRELLHRLREVALGAYAHQDLPFEKLLEALQPERSLSYTPLFQFFVQHAHDARQSSYR